MKNRIVAFSDTHAAEQDIDVPNGDILIFAGDFSGMGTLMDITSFNAWLGTLPHAHKIVIAGNHDMPLERDMSLGKTLFTNATYLLDEEVTINGLRIYGSPWTPMFNNWAFMCNEEKLDHYFSQIPEGLDILVTHGGPYGILDTIQNEHLGSMAMQKHVQRAKPKFHLFGHLHDGYGIMRWGETKFMNVSIMDDLYRPVHSPVEFNI
jgi:Icc-related predicted phosphoesterase